MFSYCTDYTSTMPVLTVYMNCDSRIAINLDMFNLDKNDEFIFVIKNHSYIESPYVFLYKAKVTDKDENGEIFIRIPPATSKHIKPGAFYNCAVMKNAYDLRLATEYQKLTDNGRVVVEYGAHDFLAHVDTDGEIVDVRLEPIGENSSVNANVFASEITGIRLEHI